MNLKKRQKVRRGIWFFMFLMLPVVIKYLLPYLIAIGAREGIISGNFMCLNCADICPKGVISTKKG